MEEKARAVAELSRVLANEKRLLVLCALASRLEVGRRSRRAAIMSVRERAKPPASLKSRHTE